MAGVSWIRRPRERRSHARSSTAAARAEVARLYRVLDVAGGPALRVRLAAVGRDKRAGASSRCPAGRSAAAP